MTQYCETCRGAFNSRIEMDFIVEGVTTNYFQCPSCMDVRKIGYSGIASSSTEEEAQKSASTAAKVAVTALGALALLLLTK